MKYQLSVLSTTQQLLNRYLELVRIDPNSILEETEDHAYAFIYLVNRYRDEFIRNKWMDTFSWLDSQIESIETKYRDMVVFQVPMWCCMECIEMDGYYVDKVLKYGLSQSSMNRTLFLNYVYLIKDVLKCTSLERYIRWYCLEGKFCLDSLLYIYMNSIGSQDEKLNLLTELISDEEVQKFPQIPEYFEPYLKKKHVENEFSMIDKYATNTILDSIMFRDVTMTQQLEIDFSQ